MLRSPTRGLYKGAQSQRERNGRWSPRYPWSALGGATTALLALLVLDVSMPGGLLGAVRFALLVGAVLVAPVYLGRRFVP